MDKSNLDVAVIGGGAAGIAAAHYLSRRHRVDLYEACSEPGGHVQTVTAGENGKSIPVDMGFIVFNNRNYPCFTRLMKELRVESSPTVMSFSYSEAHGGFAYSGHSLSGLFACRKNLVNPRFWSMLIQIKRFNSQVLEDLKTGRLKDITLGDYVRSRGFTRILFRRYLIPMVQSIWSAEEKAADNFPMVRFAHFFANHGLLSLKDRPEWMFITGGSFTYVQAFKKAFQGRLLLDSPVQGVSRRDSGPVVHLKGGDVKYQAVVLACHADTALALLRAPEEAQVRLLSPWQYEDNEVCLHTDDSFLPPNKRAWACWNYIAGAGKRPEKVNVHYYMNMLQDFQAGHNYVVTLNPESRPAQEKIQRCLNMAHPRFTRQALKAQAGIRSIQGRGGIYYCGSYHGNGFHEDAMASGVRAAQMLGVEP